MKTPITVRIEAELLEEARRCARQENRTLTNFIETVLRHRVAGTSSALTPVPGVGPTPAIERSKDETPHVA